MKEEIGGRYLGLALNAAARRDLTGSVRMARIALDAGNEAAAKLLGLCCYELGELERALSYLQNYTALHGQVREEHKQTETVLDAVRELVSRRHYRRALRQIPPDGHQTVLLWNLRGCLYAAQKRYIKASRCFGRALELDTGNEKAAALLVVASTQKRRFFGIEI